jgi:hypothetical protein
MVYKGIIAPRQQGIAEKRYLKHADLRLGSLRQRKKLQIRWQTALRFAGRVDITMIV